MKRLATLAVVVAAFATVSAGTTAAPGVACGQVLASGTYQLTRSLNCAGLPAGEAALAVSSAGGVTLDLNGYAIIGPGATTDSTGIQVEGDESGVPDVTVTLTNGTIRGFGIAVDDFSAGFDATDVRIAQNGQGIVSAFRFTTTLHESVIANNIAGDGIHGSSSGNGQIHVYDSRVSGNGGNGIYAHGAFLDVERSVISRNSSYGIDEDQFGVFLSDDAVDANGQDGIFLGADDFPDHYSLLDNSANRNGGHGIVYSADTFFLTHPLDARGNTARNNAASPQCVNLDCHR
jgi:hypothetical protein